MNNLNLIRGLFLIAFSLAFGLGALNYQIGVFSRAGPGLFPLLVSCMVFLIGIVTVVRSRFVAPVPMDYNIKNISFVLLGLCGFAVISHFANMILGIVFLVFCSSFAGTSYSITRNLKISAGLIAVAFAFRHLLGLQLPLF
jgi:Tripartite tricarboxylate transporter TctB family